MNSVLIRPSIQSESIDNIVATTALVGISLAGIMTVLRTFKFLFHYPQIYLYTLISRFFFFHFYLWFRYKVHLLTFQFWNLWHLCVRLTYACYKPQWKNLQPQFLTEVWLMFPWWLCVLTELLRKFVWTGKKFLIIWAMIVGCEKP